MPAAEVSFPSVVNTHLNYWVDGTTEIYAGTARDKLRKHDVQPVQITDMRGRDFDLDKNGFQLVAYESAEETFDNDERVKTKFYDETAELLKNTTGATRVHPFSHIIRKDLYRTGYEEATKAAAQNDMMACRTPAMFIHIDQSYDGAVDVLKQNLLPTEVETVSKTRWAIINVWRPFGGPIKREPLAVCDARTVAESDLRPVYAILPAKGTGSYAENVSTGNGFHFWNVAANPAHKWYYASEMSPDEVLMIKCFDSKKDGRARRSPHSAFQTEFDSGPPRQSIEMRCLVFWEDQEVE